MPHDHYTRYMPQGARALPLTPHEVADCGPRWPRFVRVAFTFALSAALWAASLLGPGALGLPTVINYLPH